MFPVQASAFLGTQPGHCPYTDAALAGRRSLSNDFGCDEDGKRAREGSGRVGGGREGGETGGGRPGRHSGDPTRGGVACVAAGARRESAEPEWRRSLRAQGEEEISVALEFLRANEQARRWQTLHSMSRAPGVHAPDRLIAISFVFAHLPLGPRNRQSTVLFIA